MELEFESTTLFQVDDTISGDFNRDGLEDVAMFTQRNGKQQLEIHHAENSIPIIIGGHSSFEKIGEDFSWVDYWGVIQDSLTQEILIRNGEIVGDTVREIQSPSLVLRKDEVGGGVITFVNGDYIWIHQAS